MLNCATYKESRNSLFKPARSSHACQSFPLRARLLNLRQPNPLYDSLDIQVAALLAAQERAENGIFDDTAPESDSVAGAEPGNAEVCYFCLATLLVEQNNPRDVIG